MRKATIFFLFGAIFLVGCSHQLVIKNIDAYSDFGINSLDRPLTIGIMPDTDDIHCDKLMKGIGERLAQSASAVLLPYSPASLRKVDVLAEIAIKAEYKGSCWNFLINWPGHLVLAPAWNGYVYRVNYDISVRLLDALSKLEIGSFNLPVNLKIRHAAMNRTWTGIVGAIAIVGGFVFIGYDDDVSPLVASTIREPVGDYIAQEIVARINNSGVFMPESTASGTHQ